ncbi:hypothetical protein RJT34_21686 [Clitoria ternatea]|uniref:Uncharacterized protein n=1 Tax=Clitoria ternatea TaxID=43366 RepID=A0AAN9IUZ6_CLITE
MVFCSRCCKQVVGVRDSSFLCCEGCGVVLEDFFYAEEATFVKDTRSAFEEMKYLGDALEVGQCEGMANEAVQLYKL